MNKVKQLIHNYYITEGEIGIEVEMEGRNLPRDSTKYWRVERDASLGGADNAEYVLKKPIAHKDVAKALDNLSERFKHVGSTLQPSVRAGVHVHINVQDLTLVQVANLVTLYLVVEDLLLEVCGEGRQSNLFCLKGCEAEFMIERISKFFLSSDVGYLDNSIRYSGINLAALRKYGSVEFRSFRTPKDISDIGKWVDSIKHIYDASMEWDKPSDIISGFSGFNYTEFLKKVCPLYADELMEKTDWEVRLKRGMRTAQDLAFSQSWGVVKEADPVPVPDGLPDEIVRLIEDHPHIDRQTIINMYHARGR